MSRDRELNLRTKHDSKFEPTDARLAFQEYRNQHYPIGKSWWSRPDYDYFDRWQWPWFWAGYKAGRAAPERGDK